MAHLTIDIEYFRACPSLLFDEMQKTGLDGCVVYQGVKYVVFLADCKAKEAANDPVYHLYGR